MLTSDDRERIRAEEIFRSEVREQLASDPGDGKQGGPLWRFFNSPLGLWVLSSVALGAISWSISERRIAVERAATVRRARWEVYSDGLQFERSIRDAWSRASYEIAFADKLQNPRARLFDYRSFG